MDDGNKKIKTRAALRALALALRTQADALELLAADAEDADAIEAVGSGRQTEEKVPEYAAHEGVSVASVNRWLSETPPLPSVCVGSSRRVLVAEAKAWHQERAAKNAVKKREQRRAAAAVVNHVVKLTGTKASKSSTPALMKGIAPTVAPTNPSTNQGEP